MEELAEDCGVVSLLKPETVSEPDACSLEVNTAPASLSTSGPQDSESLPTSAMVLVKRELLEEDMMDIRRIKKEVDICHMDISDGAVSKHVEGETDIEKEDSTNFSHPGIMDDIVSVAKTVETEKLDVEKSINNLERDLYNTTQASYKCKPDKSTFYSTTIYADKISIPKFEVDNYSSLEPTNDVGILNKPTPFSDILNHTDMVIEKIRAEEHFRRERGDEANKLIEREAGKKTSVGSTSDHFSQILRHTDSTIEKIRETVK